ncbi:MAG TPA: universal stress protein [Candidatus Sumerlaeota bacterium]|nr:universal stress protein [Candidatus Sumerlaeota bacterium]
MHDTAADRPRSVGPARAAAILYGDWGTSKAYVLGIAFAIAGYASFPILCAMAALTALVGINYYWVCKFYPDGGGVYSAVRDRSRMIATVGALLLIADYLVTASLSVLEGVNYMAHLLEEVANIHIQNPSYWAIGLILIVGFINWFGPRHSGSLAMMLAIPASLAAISIGLIAIPHLGNANFEPMHDSFMHNWMLFAGIVLALSGVEAVSNMTGVMVPDKKHDANGHATVKRTAAITIGLVAAEVVILTILLGAAMHSIPKGVLNQEHTDAMLGQMASYFGKSFFGADHSQVGLVMAKAYASVVGVIMALLLFSAGNTAIIGMISVYYMMSKDKEMPVPFGRLNRFGVPVLPLVLSTLLPCVLLLMFNQTNKLAGLYAIGVVGAITINLGGCATNKKLPMNWFERTVMGATAVIMSLIWITVGYEKHDALIFAIVILALGLFARSFVHERRQLKDEKAFRGMLETGFVPIFDATPGETRILVALRGVTNTLSFAIDEARQRKGRLGVVFVREVKTMIPTGANVNDDPHALTVFHAVKEAVGNDVPLDLIYRTSQNIPESIIQVIADYQADWVIMGAPSGKAITSVLRGSFANEIAQGLPPGARLLIYSWNEYKVPTPPPPKQKKPKEKPADDAPPDAPPKEP